MGGGRVPLCTLLRRGLLFLLVVSVLSMVLNIIVVWLCRLLVCLPGALSGIPLAECMSPAEEICEEGVQPSWSGCQVAYEDRPK